MLLKRANMTTLHLSRTKTIAKEAFKCLNSLSPNFINDLLNYKQSNYSFRYRNTAEVPSFRTVAYGKRSFQFEAAQVWNSLPNNLRVVDNFKEFNRLLKTWTGPNCKCAMCCKLVFFYACTLHPAFAFLSVLLL